MAWAGLCLRRSVENFHHYTAKGTVKYLEWHRRLGAVKAPSGLATKSDQHGVRLKSIYGPKSGWAPTTFGSAVSPPVCRGSRAQDAGLIRKLRAAVSPCHLVCRLACAARCSRWKSPRGQTAWNLFSGP